MTPFISSTRLTQSLKRFLLTTNLKLNSGTKEQAQAARLKKHKIDINQYLVSQKNLQ